MTARLTLAIDLGDAANAILRRVKDFDPPPAPNSNAPGEFPHIGIEPMLLALSMELALKAWFVFDFDDPKFKKSHNLSKLFEALHAESRQRISDEFLLSVAPHHPGTMMLSGGLGVEDILRHHANAFVDWRYMHEAKRLHFNQGLFIDTLEMVIREFRKRYRIHPAKPIFPPRTRL
jgi:hypothetical protein